MNEDYIQLTTIEALKYVKEHFGVRSKYALAKALSDEQLKVQPIQINNYCKGKKMTKRVADRFFEVYGIVITDYHGQYDWIQ